MTAAAPAVDVRRAADRYATQLPWLDSHHSFSFGRHYDPANTHHGVLLVNNDDVVAPGTGFETHPHRDVEIVTWVLRGSLVHQDSTGHAGVIYPGLAQRMSAGTGVLHSEKSDFVGRCADGALASSRAGRPRGERHADPVRFVQMWVVPDESGIEPGYAQREVDAELRSGALVPVASGIPAHGDAAIGIANRDVALHVARLEAGRGVALPDAPYLHLFVARGSVALEGAGVLAEGDAARLTATGGRRVTATGPAEILVWEMHAALRGGPGR
jgi:redox-sensitive bicupin YhaK (pirin superfamily)